MSNPLKQVAPPPDVSRKVALAKTFLIPAYKSVAKYLWISPKYHHTLTNICFRIFAQIRSEFRLFLLCWSVFYFQFTRSILGEQVSLNKKFCSALGCISILIFDNFFIFLTDICFLTHRFFLSCRWKLFKLFSSLLVNFQKKFSNKIQNPFSLFHAYKNFSPWTQKN